MLVTDSGMVIVVKLVQPANAFEPILVTEFGIIKVDKLVQPENV